MLSQDPNCLLYTSRRGGVSPQEAEGAWIARRIRELVEGGFTVSDKEGERPARWGDFCILPVSYTHLDVYKRQGEASPPPPGRGCVTAQDNSRFGAAAKRRACAVGHLTCAPAGGGSGYFRSAETREREETIHTPERQRAAQSAK